MESHHCPRNIPGVDSVCALLNDGFDLRSSIFTEFESTISFQDGNNFRKINGLPCADPASHLQYLGCGTLMAILDLSHAGASLKSLTRGGGYRDEKVVAGADGPIK